MYDLTWILKDNCVKKTIVASIGIAAVMGSLAFGENTEGSFSAAQEAAIQKIIRSYLVSNPEVLVEASKALQQKQLDAMQSNAMKGIMDKKVELFATKDDPIAGNADGSITIVEFFDYQCPHCIEMMPIINALIRTNANVRIVFKEFPIFGNVSNFASRAALAANLQGKYFAFYDALMNAKTRLTEDSILQLAKNTGIDIDKLQKDMEGDAITKMLDNNRELAKALQLIGTPAFVIGPTNTTKITNANTSFVAGQTTEEVLQNAINKV